MDLHHSAQLAFDRWARTRPPANARAPRDGAGASAPPLKRGSMVARPWHGLLRSLADALLGREAGPRCADAGTDPALERVARRRRRTLLVLVAASAALATALMAQVQLPGESLLLNLLQTGLFGLLFAWVAAGFFTALMGFRVLLWGDPHGLSRKSVAHRPIPAEARTAIVMPICNEHVATVFAGLRATCESLAATGGARLFDVFVLSDTSDPELRVAELAAWAELREAVGDAGRVYYRWRQRRTRRKAGNVADFCRRWGRNYRYMVVLDADSVMSGDCLLSMVRLMEAHPRAGIIQSAPQGCGLLTPHARAQQFAGHLAGRLFAAGMQYWQLGESHYWGHNAIIRIEPFMKHCALAPLPGRGSLSGEILSHDFVEAALMRRAGYQVWLVPDLTGSYEQQPPSLLTELQRDRRWCQGNLQNARLIAEPGLHPVHRAMLATGAMAYLSAPLWMLFVLLGGGLWFMGRHPLLPEGGVAPQVLALWATTLVMLSLPRLLGMAVVLLRREHEFYGGRLRLLLSTLLEAGLSAVQAPLRMVAHTLFVLGALTGLRLDWKSPPREAQDVPWSEAARRFGPISLLVLALAGAVLGGDAAALPWFAPIVLPLLLAIPLAVFTSRASVGERWKRRGLMLIPEETWAPAVLRHAWGHAQRASPSPGWTEVLGDPWLFSVVRGAPGARLTARGRRGQARRSALRRLNLHEGLEGVPAAFRLRCLSEPQTLELLRSRWGAVTSLDAARFPSPSAEEASLQRSCVEERPSRAGAA